MHHFAPENRPKLPHKERIIFIFSCYVSFREGNIWFEYDLFVQRHFTSFRNSGFDTLEMIWGQFSGSPVAQTKWLVFWMIHGARIPDPTNGKSLVDLDFLGIYFYTPEN